MDGGDRNGKEGDGERRTESCNYRETRPIPCGFRNWSSERKPYAGKLDQSRAVSGNGAQNVNLTLVNVTK